MGDYKIPRQQVNFYKNGDLIENDKIEKGNCAIYEYFMKHGWVKYIGKL